MTQIKAVIFDVGGVLQLNKKTKRTYNKGVHNFVAKKIGISLDQYFDSIDTTYSDSIKGKISESAVIKTLTKNLNIKKKDLIGYYKEAYIKHFKLNKSLLNYIKHLKKRGIRVAILSDMWHISKSVLILKEFYKLFSPVIISCDVGIRKPDKKIYLLTLSKLKLKPSETIFVDNQRWNIDTPKRMGMKTILFRNNTQTIKEIERAINK